MSRGACSHIYLVAHFQPFSLEIGYLANNHAGIAIVKFTRAYAQTVKCRDASENLPKDSIIDGCGIYNPFGAAVYNS